MRRISGGLFLPGLLMVSFLLCGAARAATVVALGASQTYGHGVARGEDYPSQLEAMLKKHGLDATVLNAGVRDGTTTEYMLSQLPKVLAPDTRVLILQPGYERAGDERKDNVGEIKRICEQRGITLLMIPDSWFKEFPRQAVDGQHLTPEGFEGLARKLLPKVIAALKDKPSAG